MKPSADVLDLFAVPPDLVSLDGGQGHSVLAGDLVLSPGRDPQTATWLNPVVARLAAELDNERPRTVRLAMPIPTRDGRWVVDGWAASRYEPDTTPCRELDVLLATAHLLSARLATRVTTRPDGIRDRDDRWARAERIAFGESQPGGIPNAVAPLVARILAELDATPLGPDQLVHGDIANNVLLDADGVPLVIDIAPYWRPVRWADAVCVLDAVLGGCAHPAVMGDFATGADRQAMLRASLFRLLSDEDPKLEVHQHALQSGPL